jgi:GT2 family glycosyltransferase
MSSKGAGHTASVCFIILAYQNSAAELERLISSLTVAAADVGVPSQCILVSNDDSFDCRKFSNVEVHSGHGNVGFAAGIRIGAHAANADYIVIANPDIIISVGDAAAFVTELIAQSTVLVPVIRDSNGAIAYTSYEDWVFSGGRRYAERVCRKFMVRSTDSPLPRWVRICGAFVGMPASIARLYGPFDVAFFMYGEDRDLTRRLRRDGIQIRLVRGSYVTHAGGGSGSGMSRELATFRADSALRVAYRRYGRCGVWLKGLDLLLEASCKRGADRSAAREGARIAAAHWKNSFGEATRLDFAAVTAILQAADQAGGADSAIHNKPL